MSKDDDLRDFMRDDDDDFFGDSRDVDPDSDIDFGQDIFSEDLDDEREPTIEQSQGPSKGFIILAVLLIVVLLVGFGVLIFALTSGGVDPLDPTRTAIAEVNATTLAQAAAVDATNTAAAVLTSTALAASPTPSPSPTATVDITATAQAIGATFTAQAVFVLATQQAIASTQQALQTAAALQPLQATQTALAAAQDEEATPTPERVTGGLSIADVQATATRLAQLFSQPTPTPAGLGLPTPTPIGGTIRGTPIATPAIGGPALPDTGLLDDLASNPGLFMLMAFGLMGVIVLARAARSRS
ncbi:MAG: hypothetical protein NZ750_12935 [Anaerolineae bacterium]|nr:hypothetical protein [Anaerolineae bacterium]MDW8173681.1 hypothetical protein [Anaerolineae bacterium]